MKSFFRAIIICCVILCVAWMIIHRRVIAAWLTGGEMPEMPEWHKKCFKCLEKKGGLNIEIRA